MCGISGYLSLNNGVNINSLIKMNDTIRHRGPDDEGYALIARDRIDLYRGKDSAENITLPTLTEADNAFLGLGFRRLAIIDLSSNSHQPMAMSSREIVVVFNGEIYNYIELREELKSKGYQFQTDSDTEVLLASYCEWDEECLNHFNGMWSFALWDGKKHKLFCARDRLGAKPFHYYLEGNTLLFGSELKQICQVVHELHFNTSYLASQLIYSISDYSDETLIKEIHVLKPGHKMTVHISSGSEQIDRLQIEKYWDLNTEIDETVSPEEWRARVAEEFSRSCNWRLRSDAPIAALLSGGLDSSCMVTELCSQMQDAPQLETFTTSYPGHSECDEWYFANIVNQSCGCRGNQIIPDPSDHIEKRFENIVWAVEGFSGLSLLGMKILLDTIHERGYRVVLNGQCGDETMFGYERYYAYYFLDLLKKGKVTQAVQEYGLASKHSKIDSANLAKMFAYFNSPLVRDGTKIKAAKTYVSDDVIAARQKDELHKLLYPSSLQQLQKNELTATQLTHIVRFDDRMYMSASIESRIPFMDYKFVELASQIPPEFKIKNGYTKCIMREIFDSRMPKEVTWRINKMGFGAPVETWARQFSKDYLLDLARNAKTAAYFKLNQVEKSILAGNNQSTVFNFVQAELFARQFNVI